MHQVLFWLPVHTPWSSEIPVYGFGAMLVVALFLCYAVAAHRARKLGIAKEHVGDVAFYVVIAGILGARIVFMIQYGVSPLRFLYFWEGGLVFYGALLGGVVGYVLAYFRVLRRNNIPSWKLADIIAPSLALGLCLGRVGCLLNGCCWGGVACPNFAAGIQFPIHSYSWGELVTKGYQPAAGFTLSPDAVESRQAIVGAVDASSGTPLRPGDKIIKANDHDIGSAGDLAAYLMNGSRWQRGETDLTLTVVHAGQLEPVTLPPFRPRTLGLYPTQIYESVSLLLLFLLLSAYFPFRRHDGEVLLLFLALYPLHRFLNEMLRNDTDPVAFGLTLSQNGSLLILAVAVGLWVWVLRKPAQYHPFAEKKTTAAAAA